MSFDKATCNQLSRFVNDARNLLTEEFTRQLQNEYGLDPATGSVTELDKLTALDDSRRETASILHETMAYYLDGEAGDSKDRKAALNRILREQAFTVLNRLCALRLAEARDLILQAVGSGYQSQGFQLYDRLAGPALGETGEAYRTFLFSIFDELAVELPPLFDRFNPEGRLFPRPTALLALLDLINNTDLETLWAEDETIGWIYQYFNSQEERRAMRAASSAPRNSRELAVRNQFFTPRYVVEFLTDNTLGRIWYEMTKAKTRLVNTCNYLVRRPTEIFLDKGRDAPVGKIQDENLSQEELLKRPVYIPHRPLKDPREIKMLDPACGSMHFGLYAFDLFEHIYEEAWELEEKLGAKAFQRLAHLDALHETYPNKAAFTHDVPRLIIEKNIHGVDIDPRAVQIAGLSLWLRAQKSWGMQGLPQQKRPQIYKSNIVCAEPMPGDRKMLDDFLATLDVSRLESLLRESLSLPLYSRLRVTQAMAKALKDLVRTVWNEMELAGEAGSLLKIEETLRDAIAEARIALKEKSPLFQVLDYGLGTEAQSNLGFWDHAEQLVLVSLKKYAEEATGDYQRRLFAGDAVQGFAFIELCRKLYDAVLMNPPFGDASNRAQAYLEKNYPTWNKNLLCSFIERGWEISFSGGAVGAIYDRTAIVKSTYEKFRRTILVPDNRLAAMSDLGWGVLDANVEVTTSVLHHHSTLNGCFIDARDIPANDKGDYIQALIQDTPNSNTIFEYSKSFQKLPNAVIGYDFPDFLRRAFAQKKSLETHGYKANQGFALKADKHFRVWWELPIGTNLVANRMFNGANFQPYCAILYDVAISAVEPEDLPMDSSTRKSGIGNHRKPGVCFGKRGDYFCAHVLPSSHIFTVEGQSIPIGDSEIALDVLAFLNTPLARLSLNKYCGQHKYSGYVNLLPYIPLKEAKQCRLKVKNVITAIQKAQAFDELQMLFTAQQLTLSIAEFASVLDNSIQDAWQQIESCESFCHEQTIESYQVTKDERLLLDEFQKNQPHPESAISDADIEAGCRWLASHAIISLSTGFTFGRWDIRFTTGEKKPPEMRDPFASLPICPPGMLQNKQGLPASKEEFPTNYPLRISWPGILADDESHPEDVVGRIRETLQVIWGENAETIEAETCQILGIASLREYFQRSNLFFEDHLKRYSKSRRQAPIYWPLSTPSGSYTLWIYYHRLNDQILFTCANDFVDPKLKQVAEDSTRLQQKRTRSRDEEAELERLVDFESELKDFRTELLHVAAFWKPNLNDGVQITAAPLWRFFQHKSWQKRLRDTWEKLEAGEYDWAHLAYSIWPERVREKCKKDKSLAIAHDLEELYIKPPMKVKKSKKKKSAGQSEIFNDN